MSVKERFMKNWYNIGMGVGLLVGLGVLVVNSKRKKKSGECEWDERQIAARGECFMIGFWALVLASTFLALYAFFIGKSLFETSETGNIIAVLIGIGAFAVAAIIKDAYFSLKENKRQFFVMGTILSIMMGLGTIRFATEGLLVADGKLCDRSLIAFVFVLWVIIMITQAIHSKREVDEE